MDGHPYWMKQRFENPGVANSLIYASQITKARHAHQLTAATLYILLHKAYNSYAEDVSDERTLLLKDDLSQQQVSLYPQFKFWYLVLECKI